MLTVVRFGMLSERYFRFTKKIFFLIGVIMKTDVH